MLVATVLARPSRDRGLVSGPRWLKLRDWPGWWWWWCADQTRSTNSIAGWAIIQHRPDNKVSFEWRRSMPSNHTGDTSSVPWWVHSTLTVYAFLVWTCKRILSQYCGDGGRGQSGYSSGVKPKVGQGRGMMI